MSALLDSLCGQERLAECARHEQLRPFLVAIKCGENVRSIFEVMAASSFDAWEDHACLLQEGEKLEITPRLGMFSEADLEEADLAYLRNQQQRDARRLHSAIEQQVDHLRTLGGL